MENLENLNHLVCPNCSSNNIEFNCKSKKIFYLNFFSGILLFIIIGILFSYFYEISQINFDKTFFEYLRSKKSFVWLVVFVILYGGLKLFIYDTESRTHVLAVCKNCGTIWNIN